MTHTTVTHVFCTFFLRRLDNYEETRKRVLRPKPRRGTGNVYIPAEAPLETDTRDDEMEVVSADNSLEGRSGKSSFHRNAIVSSLSSSKIWRVRKCCSIFREHGDMALLKVEMGCHI